VWLAFIGEVADFLDYRYSFLLGFAFRCITVLASFASVVSDDVLSLL